MVLKEDKGDTWSNIFYLFAWKWRDLVQLSKVLNTMMITYVLLILC